MRCIWVVSLCSQKLSGEKTTTHTNLFNGLSLGSLFLFLTFFLSPSISSGCSLHCQEVKSHPFVSLRREKDSGELNEENTQHITRFLSYTANKEVKNSKNIFKFATLRK